MREHRALRSVLIYALAIGLVSGANFLAVPILLASLGHEEFGRWALLEPILLATIPLAGFGIHIGLLRRVGTDASGDTIAVDALLPVHLGIALLVGLAASFIAFSFGVSFPAAGLLGAIAAVEGTLIFFVSLWRAQDRPMLFATIEGGRTATTVAALGMALLLGVSVSATSDYLALRCALGFGALLLAFAVVRPKLKPDLRESRSAIGYGAPIVVASMFAGLLISVDRYALMNVDAAAIASYVAHVKFAQLLSVAVAAFFTWFAPKAIQRLGDGDSAHPFFVGTTSAFVFVLVGLCANVWIVTPLVWPWFFPTVVLDRQLFGVLLAGTAVFALGNPLSLGALRPGKTHYSVIVALCAVAVGAGTSITLGSMFGTSGVAVGRGLGFATYAVLFAVNTVVMLRIRYPWFRMAALCVGAIIGCSTLEWFLPENDWATTVAKLLIFNVPVVALMIASLTWRRQDVPVQ